MSTPTAAGELPNWVRRSPLVPIAGAVAVGLCVDRFVGIPPELALAAAVCGIVGWCFAAKPSLTAWLTLLTVPAGLAAAHHHLVRWEVAGDDVSRLVVNGPTPMRVRGEVAEEPQPHAAEAGPLLAYARPGYVSLVLVISQRATPEGWQPVRGKAWTRIEGTLTDIHAGDLVEATGTLQAPDPPSNPGELDLAGRWADDGIRSVLRVKQATSLVRLNDDTPTSLAGVLGRIRAWAERTLLANLDPAAASWAVPLLLGEGHTLRREEWDRFVRTGVVHVLAISGQHLVVLAGFLGAILTAFGVRPKQAGIVVALFLLTYALLTGGRPSAMRAAVMVIAGLGARWVRRPVSVANVLALAAIVLTVLQPTDPFTPGFQLSFLCTAILLAGLPRWFPPKEIEPIDKLTAEFRSPMMRVVYAAGTLLGVSYRLSLVLGLATMPLVLYTQNVLSLAGILLGPPLVLLASIALVSGFFLLLLAPFGTWVAALPAFVCSVSLRLSDWLVHWADAVPGASRYSAEPPLMWVIGFYLLGAVLFLRHGRQTVMALAAWCVLGLGWGLLPRSSDTLRVTVLAVGHGTCIVAETPDGRVIVYDAGATTGPDVTRRRIAPYLWSRGIERIDELILSHADLDHFNGVPDLVQRFRIARITTTATFTEKPTAGVQATVAAWQRAGIPHQIVQSGETFSAGAVRFDVLHAPPTKISPKENAQSLVMRVTYAGRTMLWTGDIEERGLDQLLTLPAQPTEVLISPHHGSAASNTTAFAAWAKPKLVIVPRALADVREAVPKGDRPYVDLGAKVWSTEATGAVTLRMHRAGTITAETFRTHSQEVIPGYNAVAVPRPAR